MVGSECLTVVENKRTEAAIRVDCRDKQFYELLATTFVTRTSTWPGCQFFGQAGDLKANLTCWPGASDLLPSAWDNDEA